ncbi:MAG: hypothetical protein MUO72_09700 [Bacteroidales bacterium]|nr:hypothetical protein [Bacteroidales bacterium]
MKKNKIIVKVESELMEFKKPKGLTDIFNSWEFKLPRYSETWFVIKNDFGKEIIRKSDRLIITYSKKGVYCKTPSGNNYGPLNKNQIIELMKIIK